MGKRKSELTLAIIDGNDKKANDLSKAALESGLLVNQLLKACYEGAKGIEDLYSKRIVERAELMHSLEAFIAAIEPFKAKLKDAIKPGTVVLGAMESDGEWAATAYTLPLLESFGHKVHLVASFFPEGYIEEIRKYDPNVVCLTCVRVSAKHFIKQVIDALKKAPVYVGKGNNLYETSVVIGCGTHLTKREAITIGCHKYAAGYMQLVQSVNEVIETKTKPK
jgi:methanogenic corrinoid protein MtbC1